ncbi:MAG: ABC transporter ATP-binding protein [bacterium]|nr:ABC transporter ATP-binding protein [bacterium]
MPTQPEIPSKESVTSKLLRLVWAQKTRLGFGVLFMLIYALFTVAPAKYMKDIVDALGSGEVPSQSKFILVGLGIILVYFFKGLSFYGQNYLMNSMSQRMIRKLRGDMFERVLNLPVAFHNRSTTGDLLSRFTTDLSTLSEAVKTGISGPLRDLPQILILLGIMAYRSWQLFFLTLVLLPPAGFLIQKFGQQNKEVTDKRQSKFGELTSLLNETISGIRVVQAFGMEHYESRRFKAENHRLFRFFLQTVRINSYSFPILELIGGICGAAILTYGGYLIIHDEITGGDFASFIVAFFMMNEPIKKFNGFTLKIQEGLAAAQRVYQILEANNPIKEGAGTALLAPFKKDIRIQIKEFCYDPGKPILRNIDLTLPYGSITALVGSSGSGKTTLANLLPRFYDIPRSQGGIMIDGVDIRDVTLDSLRAQIALVTQEIVLFNDNIKNNISYGKLGCTEAQLVQAAKIAYAYDFIMAFEKGFETEIGEGGRLLSGGQRQRLSIGRALVKDAPILILDEATSALDTESEKEVQAAIENLMRNRTSLVIAHRLSTVQHADVIHVLKNGEVIESGNHRSLLEQKGEYFRLYQMQFRDEPTEKAG